MTADLVLTDTGHILAATAVPAWLAHPANADRVCRVVPLLPHGGDMPDMCPTNNQETSP